MLGSIMIHRDQDPDAGALSQAQAGRPGCQDCTVTVTDAGSSSLSMMLLQFYWHGPGRPGPLAVPDSKVALRLPAVNSSWHGKHQDTKRCQWYDSRARRNLLESPAL